ncbi:putative C-type lectin domain family 20 member A [Cheilinus undulatus]|uniref:putative C-type lectin domain family 20 member A n=1 Tax=Cheilinus undulatus TaxID=241271 RepID=UPI001BD66D5B|nr:putative C-type lectin domain family 20 member A [Cheilinus undulatus]
MQGTLSLIILMGQCFFATCHLYEYHFINESRSWDEAQKYCRENYTDLATVSNRTDLDRLSELEAQTDAWIGLYRKYHWSSAEVEMKHINTSMWNSDEPNDSGNCVWIKEAQQDHILGDDYCQTEHPFICVNDEVVLVKQNKTWEEALYYCRDHFNDLASITNLHQQRWVQARAKKASTSHVWLGLRYTCTLDFWFWVSDEVVSYENWALGQKMDDCDMSGAMEKGGDKWFKKQDDEKFNFICSKA